MLNRNDPWGSMKLITKYCSRKRGYKRDFVRYIVTDEFYTEFGRRSFRFIQLNTV